jgi:hypothetical protein
MDHSDTSQKQALPHTHSHGLPDHKAPWPTSSLRPSLVLRTGTSVLLGVDLGPSGAHGRCQARTRVLANMFPTSNRRWGCLDHTCPSLVCCFAWVKSSDVVFAVSTDNVVQTNALATSNHHSGEHGGCRCRLRAKRSTSFVVAYGPRRGQQLNLDGP